MSRFCKDCGAPLNMQARFCVSCGARLGGQGQPEAEDAVRAKLGPDSVNGGESHRAQPPMPGPFVLIKTSMAAGLASLRQLLKSPKQLIPVLALCVFWLILAVLSALGQNSWPIRALSFLTFAQGGMYGGAWGAMGGLVGKAIFTYFFSALLLPLFFGRNPFKGISEWLKGLLSGLAVQSATAGGELLLGAGLALITFNFLSGNASAVNSMAGVVGFVLALRALGTRGGFFWNLLLTLARPLSRGRMPSPAAISRILSGCAAGSALGVAFAALTRPYYLLAAYLPYVAGGGLLLIGLVLLVAIRPGKGAAAV